jgi:hypothetical protein
MQKGLNPRNYSLHLHGLPIYLFAVLNSKAICHSLQTNRRRCELIEQDAGDSDLVTIKSLEHFPRERLAARKPLMTIVCC